LGEVLAVTEGHIPAPGAFYKARWMANIIYSLKSFLFISQFHLSVREFSGLRDFSVFVLKIFAACAATAPQNVLILLRKFQKYKTTNERIAVPAIQSFSGLLWYVSETLLGRAMVSALHIEGEFDLPS